MTSMFYCDPCATAKGLPQAGLLFYGRCQICGVTRVCNESMVCEPDEPGSVQRVEETPSHPLPAKHQIVWENCPSCDATATLQIDTTTRRGICISCGHTIDPLAQKETPAP